MIPDFFPRASNSQVDIDSLKIQGRAVGGSKFSPFYKFCTKGIRKKADHRFQIPADQVNVV
jgi:sporulation protein YlmC with PRC-barrel domain